jgi:hypothetical protein
MCTPIASACSARPTKPPHPFSHPPAAGGSPPAPRGGRDVERPRPILQRQHGHDFEAQDMSAGSGPSCSLLSGSDPLRRSSRRTVCRSTMSSARSILSMARSKVRKCMSLGSRQVEGETILHCRPSPRSSASVASHTEKPPGFSEIACEIGF